MSDQNDQDGPRVHVDWEMRYDEWQELRAVLLSNPTPYVDRLIADGALW